MKGYAFILMLLAQTVQLHCQERYSVLITEIMADPTPQVSLPSFEWIELKNVSNHAIDIGGWRIQDASGQSGPMAPYNLLPDSIVIVCSGSAATSMLPFGNIISVTSFPSLDNNGENLSLVSTSGNVIHAVQYKVEWYENAIKREGGWSLEMIDTRRPCMAKENWKASINSTGGTPGRENSIITTVEDDESPLVLHTYALSDTSIVIVFNESLDSSSAAQPHNFTIDHDRTINKSIGLPTLFNEVLLGLNAPMLNGMIYQVAIINVKDCSGNEISVNTITRISKPAIAKAGDLIVNEILFNPRSNAYDFVEIYNAGDSVIDASTISIANRTAAGDIGSVRLINSERVYVFPGEFVAITVNAESLGLNYLVRQPSQVFEIESLPSLPDDEGTVILLNAQGDILDEVHYFDDWHFSLLADEDGVSLERIDPQGASNNSINWYSAASTAGYGTPGYRNSQYLPAFNAEGIITIEPSIFSPDNDGLNDVLRIAYKVAEQGYVANLTIFDVSGRMVRQLVRNDLLSFDGYWKWDGLDENGNRLPIGYYILHTEMFNLNGKKERFKNVVVLARMLK
jgi:hypothetical protein